MKKPLLALSVLTAVAGTVHAQTSNITIYGIVDADVARTSVNSNAVNGGFPNAGSRWLLDEGNNGFGRNGSRLGFKGTEDLGGGLAAVFQIENGFAVDTGAMTQGGLLFGRQAYVGLSSKTAGAVTLGRQYTTMHIALDSIDPFSTGMAGNIEGGVALAAGTNLVPGTAVFTTAATSGTTLFNGYGLRINNTVQYATPKFSGFSATAQYSFGEAANSFSTNQAYGVSADYNNGPIHIVGVYQQLKPLITTVGSATNPSAGNYRDRGYLIGGTYDFRVVKIHAAYGQDRFQNRTVGINTVDNQNYMVGLSAPFGPFTVLGSFISQDDRTALNADHYQYAIGATYDLSKRTNVYTSAGYLKGRSGASEANANLFQVGLQHRF